MPGLHRTMLLAAVVFAYAVAADAKPGPAKAPTLDCKAMSAVPGAPLSFEQCEQFKALADEMEKGHADGERPGDETMPCERILAELSEFSVSTDTLEAAKETVEAGDNLKSTYDAAMAESKAAASGQAATSVAGSVLSILPGGNLAAEAAAKAQIAQQAAIASRNAPKLDAARDRAMTAIGATAQSTTAMMRGNPRMARLSQLAEVKNCRAPDAPKS